LLKNKTAETKKTQEAEFEKWAAGKPEYANVIRDMNALYDEYMPISIQIPLTLNEGLMAPKIVSIALSFSSLDTMFAKK
jgi:hypothetical protein